MAKNIGSSSRNSEMLQINFSGKICLVPNAESVLFSNLLSYFRVSAYSKRPPAKKMSF